MFNRRLFLKTMSATLLPVGTSLACSGDGVDYPTKQIVVLRSPPIQNEPLSEFVTRYIGHADWFLDKSNIINLKIGNLEQEIKSVGVTGRLIVGDLSKVPLVITLPEHRDEHTCKVFDLILEKHFPVVESFRRTAGTDAYIVREKIATFSFPSPGRVTTVYLSGIRFSVPGRVICISHFEDTSGKKPSNIIVTASRQVTGYCATYPTVVPSRDYAMSSCDRLRSEKWSAHITPEKIKSWVTGCKKAIQYE